MMAPARADVADLGRAEPWLRALGLAIWAFLGVTRWVDAASWAPIWLAYGVLQLASAFHARLPRPLALVLLAGQSLAVVAMPRLGFHGFEGLLMAIVAVQMPTLLPKRASWVWAAGQLPLIAFAVWPYSDLRSLLDIFGAYSTFSAFALLVYHLYGQERRARQATALAHAELLATRAMLVEQIRRGERTALARELHDSLGHQLTALRIQLELAGKVPAGDHAPLERAQQIASTAMGELRSVVSGSRQPPPFALGEAILALASGIPSPSIHVSAPDPFEVSDPATAHALFRAAQEAITNALKHAQARNVWITLERRDSSLELEVRDDGRGAAGLSPGNGLTGLRERIAERGGTLELRSSPGFTVKVKLPLKEQP